MPRLRLVSRAETTDPLVLFMYDRKFPGRDPATDPGVTASGAPGNYEAVLAHSPDILEHAVQGFYLKQTKKRKLPLALMELAITRIGWACGCRWMYSEHSKILRGLGFAELTRRFTEEQIIELTYIVGMFMMNAHMIRALRLEWDDHDDPVREMASPPDYRFVDREPSPLPKRV